MDFFVEIIFRGLIINFLGVYIRYSFFKIIGKPKDLNYIKGEVVKNDIHLAVSQHSWNVIIGLVSFVLISITVAFFVYQ